MEKFYGDNIDNKMFIALIDRNWKFQVVCFDEILLKIIKELLTSLRREMRLEY